VPWKKQQPTRRDKIRALMMGMGRELKSFLRRKHGIHMVFLSGHGKTPEKILEEISKIRNTWVFMNVEP